MVCGGGLVVLSEARSAVGSQGSRLLGPSVLSFKISQVSLFQ